jgi:hypothetical protein
MMLAPILNAGLNGQKFELVPMIERTGPEVLHLITTNMGKRRALMFTFLYIWRHLLFLL